MYTNTKQSYGSVSKTLHWVMSMGIIGLLIVGFIMGTLPKPLKFNVYDIHKLTGLTILALAIVRLAWTLSQPKPEGSRILWERIAEHSVHGLLYLGMFAMPLSGWMMSTAGGHTPSLMGISLPMPGVVLNKPLAHLANQVHYCAAWALIGAISIHVLAALKHHFIDKDHILRRMLPKKS